LVVAVLVGVAFFLAFGWLATWRIIGNSPQLRDVVPRRGKCAPMESNNAVCNLQVPRARNIKSNRRATEFADDANSRQCKIAEETRDKITEIYVCSLQKKLIRCWEIEERFRSGFKSAVESYKPPSSGSQFVQLPQIPRLDEECHNFLYEMKNYVRDLL